MADTLALVSLKLANIRAALKVRGVEVPNEVEAEIIDAYAIANRHFVGSADTGVMLPWQR